MSDNPKYQMEQDIKGFDTSGWRLKDQHNGGHNSFYDFPLWVNNIDKLAEYLQLSFYEGNILKSLTANLGQRHNATDKTREVNKCLHYAKLRAEAEGRKDG